MKKIYIVGGNGFARKCFYALYDTSLVDSDITFAGFLGHNGYKVDFKELNKYFAGDLSEHSFKEDEYVLIGAAYPNLRKKIYEDLKKKNAKFINLIPPFVYLKPGIEIGEGNIFAAPCSPGPNVKIGNCNVFNGDVIIGHDVQIGDFNFFGGKSQILGNTKIGSYNLIAVGAIALPNSKIGDNNKISPLSVIYKGCKNNCLMHGNPALKIGTI